LLSENTLPAEEEEVEDQPDEEEVAYLVDIARFLIYQTVN
jgi:hypothetical protein